ncbi:MAG: MFS transporter [Betaproteobacteria bacterium]|nr:MFS transporter [Betaproteobacteria bacterium]
MTQPGAVKAAPHPGKSSLSKIFHGWRIAGAASTLQFMQSALLTQSFGAYVALLAEERGWSKTSLAGAAAMQSMEAAILGPVLGWVMDRFGPQAMIRWGIVAFALGFFALSQLETLTGFYVSAVTLAIGASLCGYFPLTVAIIHWFERHRARALSLLSLGLALGGLAVPLVAWSMHSFGWRTTAIASGVVALLVGFPLASLIRGRPEDMGLTIDGVPKPAPMTADGQDHGAPAAVEFTARQALRTQAFWLLGLGHGVALLVVTAVNVHAITHMKEGLGYTVAEAAWFILLMTVGQVMGVLSGAWMGDKYDKRRVAATCMLMHGTGLLLLTYATHSAELVAFALLHGIAWGLRGPFMQALRADYFGRNAIGMILGLSAVIIAMGQIAGPMVAGFFADLTGNYRMGFTILALMACAGSGLFLLAKPPRLPTAT